MELEDMFLPSQKMHVFMSDYLEDTQKIEDKQTWKGWTIWHARGLGFIGIEIATLVTDVALAALGLLIKFGILLVHTATTIGCTIAKKSEKLQTLNEKVAKINERFGVFTILGDVVKTTAGLALGLVLAWACPDANYSWHDELDLVEREKPGTPFKVLENEGSGQASEEGPVRVEVMKGAAKLGEDTPGKAAGAPA